ncbi:mitotubule-associated protein Gb4 [Angomonas deanei]|nr:mitotubule-associated protein Gb4 [Angomonas deanei]|eukprot:EPY30789.1 mitotubule-associated protein Gb4 [Angomonas deanei]
MRTRPTRKWRRRWPTPLTPPPGTSTPTENAAMIEDRAAPGFGSGDRESGELQRTFEGDDWDLVLEGGREDVDDAFKKGVSDALGVSKSNVTVLDAQLGSLIVDYKVRGYDGEDDEINQKVGDHDFPELMEMYKARMRGGAGVEAEPEAAAAAVAPLAAERDYTLHDINLEGDAWEFVMSRRAKEVHQALEADTREALQVEQEDVLDVITKVSDSALKAVVKVKRRDVSVDEIQAALEAYEFPATWALYCPPEEAPKAVKTFDGEHWDDVTEEKESALRKAFQKDTGAALNVPAEDIDVTSIGAKDDKLEVQYAVQFSDLTNEEIENQTDSYPYPSVWALYETPEQGVTDRGIVAGEENFVKTEHHSAFEGDGWTHVIKEKEGKVAEAFKEDTAEIFGLEPRHIKNLQLSSDEKGAKAEFELLHDPELDADTADEKMKEAEYHPRLGPLRRQAVRPQ